MKCSKPAVMLAVTVLLIALGAALLVAGICIPPEGEIHNSILIAFGEILTFAGTVFGINYHYKYRIPKSNAQD